MAKWLSLLSTALIAIIVLGLMTLKLILVHKLSKNAYSAYSNCSTGSNKRTGWQYFQVKLPYREEKTLISVPVIIFYINFLIFNSNHVVCK